MVAEQLTPTGPKLKVMVLGLFNAGNLPLLDRDLVERASKYTGLPLREDQHDYPFHELVEHGESFGGVIHRVSTVAHRASLIVFLLDGLRPGYPRGRIRGYTNQELACILSNPEFAAKTQFYRVGVLVPEHEVREEFGL